MKFKMFDGEIKAEDLEETPMEKALKKIRFDLESKNSLLKMENERLTKLFQKTLQSKVYQLFLAFPDYDYISCNHFHGVALHKKMPMCYGGAIFFKNDNDTKVLGHDFNPQDFPLEESFKLEQCGKDCAYSGQDDCKSRIYRRKDYFENDSYLKIMKLKKEIEERLNEILKEEQMSRYGVGERKEWYNSGYIDALIWVLGVEK